MSSLGWKNKTLIKKTESMCLVKLPWLKNEMQNLSMGTKLAGKNHCRRKGV